MHRLKKAQRREKSPAADEEFLMMLKETCAMTDEDWEEKQTTQLLEMEAMSKALVVLSGDDAHDLFTRTYNPAFVQEPTKNSQRRDLAAKLLSEVAKRLNSLRLPTLAYKVRLDAFTRVTKAIDDMLAQLTKEKQD
mmetsp:Transcript_119390/g.237938  ORF Transcript_119390/g.237938 Transcript_119390/m.237938 type:complete len:136 (-) Transcript_119390:47-454(-)